MLRFFIIDGGMVAESCFQNWMQVKMLIKTPKTTKRAMIRPLPHAYLVPPHWRASSRQMMAGIKAIVPYKSNSLTRSFQPREATAARSGDLKKIMMTRMVMAPIGKLMKKHHLQVAAQGQLVVLKGYLN